MSISIESPLIKELRSEIEKHVGKINTHDKFLKLQAQIEEKCKEYVSISTLERIWGYSTRNANNISERILDIMARFVNAENWDTFCAARSSDSELFYKENTIDCSSLATGTRIRLTWLPDRECEIEYLGNNSFVATATKNSTIKPGDTFRCLNIEQGRELYMDNFTRHGQPESCGTRYVIGKNNGLTLVELL